MKTNVAKGWNGKKREADYAPRRERSRDWAKVIAKTYDWDWAFMLEIWIYALTRMRDNERDHGHHDTSAQDARQMTEAIELMERAMEGDYGQNEPPTSFKKYNAADKKQQQDLKKALKIVSENLFHWWD